MTNKHLAAVLCLAAGLAAAPAGAQGLADLKNPTQQIASFEANSLVSIAREIGYQGEVMKTNTGLEIAKIRNPGGNVFHAAPTACNAGKCIGLYIFANFGPSTGVSLDKLSTFDYYQRFTSAYTGDGVVILSRYEISDFGVAKGNIASNFTNFTEIANVFANHLQGKTASTETSKGGTLAGMVNGTHAFAGALSRPVPSIELGEMKGVKIEAWTGPDQQQPDRHKPVGPPNIR